MPPAKRRTCAVESYDIWLNRRRTVPVDDHLERFVTETQGKYLYSMIWSENSNNQIHRLLGYNYTYLEAIYSLIHLINMVQLDVFLKGTQT